jgi:NAD(P)-dependent dehydrogenase (short-subunit alcohol dehydrogenase family)
MSKSPFVSKVALITGGASGIGAALARELAHQGAEVVLADRQADVAEGLAAELRGGGARVTAAELDVRSLPAFERVVKDAVSRSGRIDYLFNNAGIGVGGEMDAYTARDWDDVIDVNLRGVAHGIQAVYPVMIRQGSGHIVNTASMAGLVGAAGEGSYTATKHAVVGLSKTLRIEARRHGVRCSVLCPGAIRTPILTGGKFGRVNIVGLTEDKMLEMWAQLRPMNVDVFAKKALAAVAGDEAIIVLPRWWKAFWYAERLSPALGLALWGAILGRMRRDLADAGARPMSSVERASEESRPQAQASLDSA